MRELSYVPFREFKRLRDASCGAFETVGAFADLCRVNVLYMIMQAGSGHIGSSFSSMEMISWLYLQELRLPADIFFSSKGHDAPAFYAVLIGLGLLEENALHRLRRLGGLPGHPDVGTPFIEANTGSLGMGLSKAKGMLLAARMRGKPKRAFVLTGDGEWQEGQMWEAMFSAAHGGFAELTVIVDHNKLQSDTFVDKVSPLGDLERKFESFGWRVFRCDGHDLRQLAEALSEAEKELHKPKVIVADTVKGKGVSFMEGPAMGPDDRVYAFHSGAPAPEIYEKALRELQERIETRTRALGLAPILYEKRASAMTAERPGSGVRSLVDDYAEILTDAGAKRPNLVVLDADLAKDCGLLHFEKRFPERFIECGIAEQDMVSQAGGLALQGFLPVVHSFASFLSGRANDQMFSNATERRKIIYVASLAGLLPAGPGHSHQAVRDIAAVGAMPGLRVVQPCCRRELEAAFSWAILDHPHSTYVRLSSVAHRTDFPWPADPIFCEGHGVALNEGEDGILFAYGPVMVSEAWKAALILKKKWGIALQVVDLPWLNSVDKTWLKAVVLPFRQVFTVDDHFHTGGQGRMLAAELSGLGLPVEVSSFGVEGIPHCGQNKEVLFAHGLDADTLAHAIARRYKKTPSHVFK